MKYLQNLLNKNKASLVVFTLSFFLSLPYVAEICSGYLSFRSFDVQEFMLWHFASLNGTIPYRDIFYPYGLLSYFKNVNIFFALIYYLLSPVLLTIVYFIFSKVFRNKFVLFFSFTIFYTFILIFTGFETFSRYGILVVFSLLLSYILYSYENIRFRTYMYLGILLGIIVSTINDQGVYLLICFIFLYSLTKYLRKNEQIYRRKFFIKIVKQLACICFGILLGVIPLLVYLFYHESLGSYFGYFKDISEIIAVSKTPFFSFIDSPANIFTISILFFAIFYNFFKLFFCKYKFALSSFLQISLIISVLIMEQKSIIRSIDRQIVFASLMLLMLIVYELLNIAKSKNKKAIYVVFITTVLVLYGFNVERPVNNFLHLFKSFNLLIGNKCFENNLNYFLINNPSYAEIVSFLKKQQDFNGKISSFSTGDSMFYILLNQKPPYYNAIFEGSSYEKQNYAIKYIINNKVSYVILNTSKSSLQDQVPDYIRQSFLFEYILKNFKPYEVIGNYVVLKRTKSDDFFASKILNQVNDYKKYLLDIYLYKIPYSEGLYKYDYLKDNNKLIVEGNINEVNSFLTEKNFSSRNKVIVLIPNASSKQQELSFVGFQSETGFATNVYYNSCNKNKPCLINLSRIPLFYQDRLLKEIAVNNGYKGNLRIFDLKNSGNLW